MLPVAQACVVVAAVFCVLQDSELSQRELWEQCCSTQTELEAAVTALHFVRHLSQLRADTAQVKAHAHTLQKLHLI